MISAKRAAFREEIRRRQIEEKFKTTRKEIILEKQFEAEIGLKLQFIQSLENYIQTLKNSRAERDNFSIYEFMGKLKDHIQRSSVPLKKVATEERFHVIEEVAQVLLYISQSDLEEHNKLPVFGRALSALVDLISIESIKTERIVNSELVEVIAPYLKLNLNKEHTLEKLFCVLGNIVIDSEIIANQFTRLNIPSLAIEIILKLDPNANAKYLPEFMFFLSRYFENTKAPEKLSQPQVNACLVVAREIINIYSLQNFHDDKTVQTLQDAMRAVKEILNFQMATSENYKNIDYKKLLNFIPIKNYPITLKKEALFIIDSMIYLDDNSGLVEDLVENEKILMKILGIEEQIIYISFNILANLALYPSVKQDLLSELQRIRLNINLNSQRKQIYYFINNYFSTQKFQINNYTEEKLIHHLWGIPDTRPEIKQIEAKIWLGLIANGYRIKPPLKILQAHHIREVEDILYLLQRQGNVYSMFEQSDYL